MQSIGLCQAFLKNIFVCLDHRDLRRSLQFGGHRGPQVDFFHRFVAKTRPAGESLIHLLCKIRQFFGRMGSPCFGSPRTHRIGTNAATTVDQSQPIRMRNL
jgi:hypothetical protein